MAQSTSQHLTSAITSTSSLATNGHVVTARDILVAGNPLQSLPNRVADRATIAAVVEELRLRRAKRASDFVKKAKKLPHIDDEILKVLKEGSISAKTSGFGDPVAEDMMREKLKPMLDRQRPLNLTLLMGGGKVANPLKTGYRVLPDLAEWHAWSMLEGMAMAIEELYAPGAAIIAIPDAALHTADLGFPLEDTRAHLSAALSDLRLLGIERVSIPDVMPILDYEWVAQVQAFVSEVRERYLQDHAFAEDVRQQVRSLVYSVNSRAKAQSFDDLTLMYAAVGGHVATLGARERLSAALLYQHAEDIAFHYVAVNWAIRRMNLVERVTEQVTGEQAQFRMSVHAKKGEPRPMLFEASSLFPGIGGLLPMHAVGVRAVGPNSVRYGALFEIEAIVRQLMPVESPDGRFMWYEMNTDS